ncbi:MAG: AAA domain-containing protein [Metamycoplasmataceae bacterium]
MEFKILQTTKSNIYSEIKSKRIIEAKYSKILNNLLSINSRSDYAIFAKINLLNKDLNKILKEEDILKIFNNCDFKIKLKKIITPKIKNDISEAIDYLELIEILDKIDFNLNATLKKQLSTSFENAKNIILERIEKENNIFLTKWKKYYKGVRDAFSQTNIWPLFIGSYFIKGVLNDKAIYAPLILKEVDLEIIDNEVYLIARSKNVFLNDKLTFFLNNSLKIETPFIDQNIDKISFSEIFPELDFYFKNIIDIQFLDITNKFQELTVQQVNNTVLEKTNGILLTQCQPSGSSLRKATLDIIESGKINELLYIENNLVDFNKRSIDNIINENKGIVRICKTDASQEKAILSSLNEHAIIIGPPGTGKSQTIANLLTNILYENKRALFISQKRVALEVVIERMNELQYFMLQLVEKQSKTDKNEKAAFYHRLNKFISYTKYDEIPYEDINLTPFIDKKLKKYWQIKKRNANVSDDEINLICKIKNKIKKNHYLNEEVLKNVKNHILNIKKFNTFGSLETILKCDEIDKKILAKKINYKPKNILGFKIYSEEFKMLFESNLFILNFLKENNQDLDFISLLDQITNIERLIDILKSFHLLENKISSSVSFSSDERFVLNYLISNAKTTMQNIQRIKKIEDKTWMQKFLGRIEREFTQPQNFIFLFKKELKKMFNVIVSTPESLAGFIDFKKDKFDYIIFDEASQIFIEKAIPFISIGTKIIIAGDDQQMQPSNWFTSRVSDEQEEDEAENVDSLLTYAIANSLPKYNLELNYRSSSAALTTFSSKQFYNCDLKTLDKNGVNNTPIEVINVNGEWINNCNIQEARFMINELKNNIDYYEKIILLTFNKNQSELVEDILINQEPGLYEKIIEGNIILKNIENIQGDEADLVIASVGYTKDAKLSATYVGRSGGKNALNVAITRAKKKMIILKSISSNEISISNNNNLDLLIFKNWIEFLELSESKQKEYSISEYENNHSVESGFENDVYKWLLKQSFNEEIELITQYPIGSYKIDLALINKINGKFILGIEVDGFRYHSSANQKYNDIVRQDFIEAKGYKLIRISELLWKGGKEKVLQMIKNNF